MKGNKRFKQAFNVLSTAVVLSGALLPLAPKEAKAAVVPTPRIVDVGFSHSLAIGEDGKVYAWGYNSEGQLGDGTKNNRNTPVQVQGLSNVVTIAAGNSHSLAVTADGKVYAWGGNLYGELGDGTKTKRTAPVLVSSFVAKASLLSGGGNEQPVLPAAPVIQVSPNGWTTQPVQVTILYPDNADTKEYRINGGAWQPYTGPITMTENGVIEARAGNRAGMSETTRYEVSNIQRVEVSPPAAHVQPDTLMFDAPQGTTVQVKINGGAWQTYTAPIVLPDGLYDVEAKAVDASGHESSLLRMSVTMYGEQLFRTQQLAEAVMQQPTKEHIASLEAAIQSLPDQAEEKDDLMKQLESAKETLAETLVNEAKANPSPAAIQAAKEAVGAVADEAKRQSWMDDLEALEASLRENEGAMSVEALLAKHAIERANAHPAQALLTYAYRKVAAVPLDDPHLPRLQEMLAQVQAEYDARAAKQKQSEALMRAQWRVKALEQAYSAVLLRQAQTAVDALPDGEDKALLQARIDQAVRAQEAARVQAQVEAAAKAVAQAEVFRTKNALVRAEDLVKALPDGQTKQTLQGRIDTLRSVQDPAVAKAVEAIQLAKRYPTVNVFYKRAVDAIRQVQDETKRQSLMDELNAQ